MPYVHGHVRLNGLPPLLLPDPARARLGGAPARAERMAGVRWRCGRGRARGSFAPDASVFSITFSSIRPLSPSGIIGGRRNVLGGKYRIVVFFYLLYN